MKILVCGNMGYVGPVVCKHLKLRFPHAFISGFDSGFFAPYITTTGRLGDTYCDQQLYGDIRTISPDVVADFDTLVVLSAISNDPMGMKFATVTDQINKVATIKIIERFLAGKGKTVVFASSCSIYGNAGSVWKKENDQLNPLTEYAKSKVAVEEFLQSTNFKKASKGTSLRFATACGMSDRLRLDLALNDFVASSILANEIKILSDGSPLRPLINVQDMARAVEWAIVREASESDSYLAVNVGSNDGNYSVLELAEAVKVKLPEVEIDIDRNKQPDKRSYKVCFDLFEDLAPDHQPQIDLEKTIDELVVGINKIKDFIGINFRSSTLFRLNVLNNNIKNDLLTADLFWNESKRD